MECSMIIGDNVIHVDKSSMYKSIIGTLDFTKNPPEYIPKSLIELLEEEDNESRT